MKSSTSLPSQPTSIPATSTRAVSTVPAVTSASSWRTGTTWRGFTASKTTSAQAAAKRDAPQPARVERKASNKQIGYINSLVSKKGVALSELTADIRRRFNAEGLYDLTAKQASAVIDELNQTSRDTRAA